MTSTPDWWIYRSTGAPHAGIDRLPEPPSWRSFRGDAEVASALLMPPAENDASAVSRRLGRNKQAAAYKADRTEIEFVNLALHLRRPLLVTGKPGVGKSTLAYAVAHELGLGPVLRWPITSRTVLHGGLYEYDAIGRLHDAGLADRARFPGTSSDPSQHTPPPPPDISRYLRLGPLGTAFLPWGRPRALLIDEIDKSDIDLPSDLLNLFEDGEFLIPELARLGSGPQDVMTADPEYIASVTGGLVRCAQFPFIVLTSNGERDFPPAFLRRCIRLEIQPPDRDRLNEMITAHLSDAAERAPARNTLLADFLKQRDEEGAVLAGDQLLNALLMAGRGVYDLPGGPKLIADALFRRLDES
ncbi:MoxR family ATPase [Streptomyces atriruber]|uniref:MoxR family ATPase n=1 Tax=Streptomyces atriruber TaxID=545121 RepID=A0ABV3BSZ6_9ACTN